MAVERDAVVNFLNKKTRADLSSIADDTELFSTGMIDSFTMVDLLMWIEKQTGSRVSPEDVSVDNLDTIARILKFAAARTKS